MRPILLSCAVLLSLAAAPMVLAQSADNAGERRIMSSAAFLSGHPDLRYRLSGLDNFRKGHYDEAMIHFRRAARYSDKPSQGMIGEMYWEGTGVAHDKARG